jgi:hypothetical protein
MQTPQKLLPPGPIKPFNQTNRCSGKCSVGPTNQDLRGQQC